LKFWGKLMGAGADWPRLEKAIASVVTAQLEWSRGIHRLQAQNATYLRQLGAMNLRGVGGKLLTPANIEMAAKGAWQNPPEALEQHENFRALANNFSVIKERASGVTRVVSNALDGEGRLGTPAARKVKVQLQPTLVPRRVLSKLKRLPAFRKALRRHVSN
jgi:hypothetical protein